MIAMEHTAESRRYESLRSAIDGTIDSAIADLEPALLREAVAHAAGGGKRVRPMLAVLMCGAVGGREADALQAAAAIELMHTSSLVHDDIMDRSELRRGRETLHHLHGIPTAVLAGDALLAVAFRMIQRVASPNSVAIMEHFAGAFLHVCEGQGLDLHLEGKDNVPSELHRRMVEKKTARLIESASAIGALLGTADPVVIREAALFGYNIGMAFQAHDDLLDAVGEEEVMGKPAGIDSRNGKQTYLTLAYPAPKASCERAGGIEATRHLVARYTTAACAFLDTLPASESREMLRNLATSLAERRS